MKREDWLLKVGGAISQRLIMLFVLGLVPIIARYFQPPEMVKAESTTYRAT